VLFQIDGVEPLYDGPVVREFAVRLDADVAAVRRRCARAGINPGADIFALTGREQDRGGLLVALTERRTREEIDRLAEILAGAVATATRTNPGSRERLGEQAVPA